MDTSILKEIGLTDSEIKVYLALLELGSSTTGPIVEKSGVASSKIYEVLEKLMQKGLASFVIASGTKHFEAASPRRVEDYIREKQRRLAEQAEQIKKIIPELELKMTIAEKSETIVFKGINGAQTAFEDILLTLGKNDEFVVLGFSDTDELFQQFLLKFHQRRSRLGISFRGVFGDNLKEMALAIGKLPRSQIKLFPSQHKNPIAILVYADKTIFSLPTDRLWIQVKNLRLADSFRTRFEELWNQHMHVYNGFDAVMSKFATMLDGYKVGEEYYVIGATYGKHKKELQPWFIEYHKKRVQRGIGAKLLYVPHDYSGITYQFLQADPSMVLSELKPLSSEFSAPMQINLYKNNRVLFFLFGDELSCFEIESKELYANFKRYFDALWGQETRVLRGLDAVQGIFEEILEAGSVDFIGAKGYFIDERPRYVDDWEKRAVARGLVMRNLVDTTVRGHRVTSFSFAQTRYTLPQEFSNLSVFWIYGKKVVIANWINKKDPLVFVIENEVLHNVYHQQFELLWNSEIIVKRRPNIKK